METLKSGKIRQKVPVGCLLLLFMLMSAVPVLGQDWRYSAGYAIQNFPLVYETNDAFSGEIRSTQKGVAELEFERYLLYRLYISGKADYLVHNNESFLFGGPVDFDQLGASANIGMQFLRFGVYAGLRTGRMWNMRFRGVTPEGEDAWVSSVGDSNRLLAAGVAGIKFYPMRYLRLDASVHRQLTSPERFEPASVSGFTPQINAMEFKQHSFQAGVTVSIPLNSTSRSRERVRHIEDTGKLPAALNIGLLRFSSPLTESTRVTSGYGFRGSRPHQGVDLNVSRGKPVVASASGVVIKAEVQSGFGNMVEIMHRGGYSTIYAHLDRIRVSEGEKVQRGQRVGDAGDTGQASGVHLHFEIRREGVPVNPTQYVRF